MIPHEHLNKRFTSMLIDFVDALKKFRSTRFFFLKSRTCSFSCRNITCPQILARWILFCRRFVTSRTGRPVVLHHLPPIHSFITFSNSFGMLWRTNGRHQLQCRRGDWRPTMGLMRPLLPVCTVLRMIRRRKNNEV